jgi:hypothetical protein
MDSSAFRRRSAQEDWTFNGQFFFTAIYAWTRVAAAPSTPLGFEPK